MSSWFDEKNKTKQFSWKKWKGAVSNWFTVENNNDLLLAYNLNVVYVQKVYNFRGTTTTYDVVALYVVLLLYILGKGTCH